MIFDQIVNLLATVTLFEMMVSIGLGVTFSEVVGVARNRRFIGKALFANYVFFPAVAVALLLAFRSNPMVAAGFLIAAVCPGAPFGPPLTAIAKGNVVTSVGLMVVLAGSSAFVAPLLLYFLLPLTSGGEMLRVDAGKMVSTLLVVQFLPLCSGLGIRQRFPAIAVRLNKPAKQLSLVLNLALLGLIIIGQFSMLTAAPLRAYVGMLCLVLTGLLAGWMLGGPAHGDRTALAVATSVRNVGVSLVIATASFPGTQAVTATTVFAVFQTILVTLLALIWRRWSTSNNHPVDGRPQD
jgi:bile acid:Na+ symporter, BASS family